MTFQELIDSVPEDNRNLEFFVQFHQDESHLFYPNDTRVKAARRIEDPDCVILTIGKPRKVQP